MARWDRASRSGPWTGIYLALLQRCPGVRAGDLADEVGMDKARFKARVRKLKSLGLTESLEVGYRLSPRGITDILARQSGSPVLVRGT